MAIQSSSMTHMKVLLKKDRLTLKRNWSFLVSFVLMPLFLMGFFSFLYNKVSGAKEEEKHNFNCKSLWPLSGLSCRLCQAWRVLF